MLLGAIADDFTGAGDLANTLAREGMRTALFSGPRARDEDEVDAGVVALKTRSIPAQDAVAQSLAAAKWLLAQGCRQILFKYCSTFDSTPRGNIGPVGEALLDLLDAPSAVVCPAFPRNGRTVYQGCLFVGDRPLNESGMERHPLNPMTDPDIRRWLARQCKSEVGHVAWQTVQRGAQPLRSAIAAEAAKARRLIVVDALTETDLRTLGAAVAGDRLVTGGSGVALGLADNFRAAGLLGDRPAQFAEAAGPAVVLSGSCSLASRRQLAAYLEDHPGFPLPVDRVVEGAEVVDEALQFFATHRDAAPAIYSSADPEEVAAAQRRWGGEEVAARIEGVFAGIARALVAAGVRRLAVGGGETSGAVVTALGLDRLEIGPEIDPGVPALSAKVASGALALALKSGNFGGEDFYARALAKLEPT